MSTENSNSERVSVARTGLVLPLPGFTPGPWKHLIHEKDGEQKHVVETGPPAWVPLYPDGVTDEEIAANCDLISAAPELLECLIHLAGRDWFREGVTGRRVACHLDPDKVRNAVRKALGQNA